MNIRTRRLFRGWKGLLAEVGVVMVGILLALGAEALVEQRRWQQEAAVSEEAIKLELLYAASNSWERLLVGPCLSGKIGALAERPAARLRLMPRRLSAAPVSLRSP